MTWGDEYRAKNEEVEDLALGHVASLEAKVVALQKELRRRHLKTTIISWTILIAVIAFEVWFYSR